MSTLVYYMKMSRQIEPAFNVELQMVFHTFFEDGSV